jgi:hypothetical protein
VFLVVLLLALIVGGVYAYYEYYLPTQTMPPADEQPEIAGSVSGPDAPEQAFPAPPPDATSADPAAAPPAETAQQAAESGPEAMPPPEPEPVESAPTPPPAPPKEVAPPKPEPAPPKPAQTHWVQVRSRPPGAMVTADDDPELTCKTPCEVPLREGRHVLNFTLAGHRLAPRIIRVPDLTDITVRLTQEAGTLAIRTTPPGASIFINGESRTEKTPAMVKLPVGRYRIRLTLEGYPDYEDAVDVRDQVITAFGIDW